MNNFNKAIVLISGGLDSTTTLAIAKDHGFNCYGLSFDYKQRHISELDAAKNIARSMHITEHKIIKIDFWILYVDCENILIFFLKYD